MSMPRLYVYLGKNIPAKGSKVTGVSINKKQVEFNQDVRMKYIPNITRVQEL